MVETSILEVWYSPQLQTWYSGVPTRDQIVMGNLHHYEWHGGNFYTDGIANRFTQAILGKKIKRGEKVTHWDPPYRLKGSEIISNIGTGLEHLAELSAVIPGNPLGVALAAMGTAGGKVASVTFGEKFKQITGKAQDAIGRIGNVVTSGEQAWNTAKGLYKEGSTIVDDVARQKGITRGEAAIDLANQAASAAKKYVDNKTTVDNAITFGPWLIIGLLVIFLVMKKG